MTSSHNVNDIENDLPAWHASPAEKVLEYLASSTRGLTTDEVLKRRRQYGPNRLPAAPQRSRFVQFLSQFNNVLIYVLLGAAVFTALLADWVDAGVIIAVVLINAVIGFIQEGKAEKAVDAIRKILSYEALVLRDGNKVSVKVEDLVPGDIVFLQSGDKVPADMRLFQSKNLRVEEALLTGESVPVDKSSEPAAIEAALGDRSCMAFSGTMISFGQGSGVVVATGASSEIGKVSALLAGVESLETRLTQRMDEFSKWLTGAILILAAGTMVFGLALRDYSFNELFFAGVALAVAAIPEGLPAIITITLALGVQRMARKKAIIRRLPAVETLGSVTVICSDKTGTLTRNEMTVTTILRADREYHVDGAGYQPHGSFHVAGNKVEAGEDQMLLELARAGLLCNDGSISENAGSWSVQGDPTDGALISLALKTGLNVRQCNEELPRNDVIPFESDHKFMATLHQDSEGRSIIYLKGTPLRCRQTH